MDGETAYVPNGFSQDLTVQWSDTDAAGHHHHTAIARFAEATEAAWMRALDLPDYFGRAPRVRYEVDYLDRLFFGQTVRVTLRITHVGTSSLHFAFEVWALDDQGDPTARAAAGKYVTVHASDATSGASPWPPQWRDRLTAAAGAPR